MPNALAYLVLLIWPFVVIIMFRRLALPSALIWSVLAAYLLLPSRTELDLSLVPALNKTMTPSLAAFAMCLLVGAARRRMGSGPSVPGGRTGVAIETRPGWLPESRLAKSLLVAFVFGPFVTVLLNDFPITFGNGTSIRGLTPYDGFSLVMNHSILLLPLLMGRRYLAGDEQHRTLLRALALAGLAYSLPILLEVRLSPQLHTWIYGFFPHSFAQHIRYGGFRPVVFLEHGLLVAIFVAMALISAIALSRTSRGTGKVQWVLAAAWLCLILFLCKSLGPVMLVLATAPFLVFARQRMQLVAAAAVALLVLLYPALHGTGIIPAKTVASLAALVDEGRAGSFMTRVENEERLLEHLGKRPLFGWGIWGRHRVYDPYSGEDISVTDSYAVITASQFGWVGYLANFGLFTLPIFLLARRHRRNSVSLHTTTLGLLFAINLLDLLPNSSVTPLTWLIAGALLGRVEQLSGIPQTASRARDRAGGLLVARNRVTLAERLAAPRPTKRAPGPRSLADLPQSSRVTREAQT